MIVFNGVDVIFAIIGAILILFLLGLIGFSVVFSKISKLMDKWRKN